MTSNIHQHAVTSHSILQATAQQQQQLQQSLKYSQQQNNMAINSSSSSYLDHHNAKVPIKAPPRSRHTNSSISSSSTSTSTSTSTSASSSNFGNHVNNNNPSFKASGQQRGHQRRQSVARLLPDISKLRLLSWLVEASSEMINCDIAIMDGVYAKLNHSQESLLFWSPQPASSGLLTSAQSTGSNSSSTSLRTLLAHEHECSLNPSSLPANVSSFNGKTKVNDSQRSDEQQVANFQHLSLSANLSSERNNERGTEIGDKIVNNNNNIIDIGNTSQGRYDELNKDILPNVSTIISSKVKLSKKQLKQQRKMQQKQQQQQQQQQQRDKLSLPLSISDESNGSSSNNMLRTYRSANIDSDSVTQSVKDDHLTSTNQERGLNSGLISTSMPTSMINNNNNSHNHPHKTVSSPMIVTSPISSSSESASAESSSSSASSTSSFVCGASDSAGSTPTSSSPPTLYDDSPLDHELQIVSDFCCIDSSISSSSQHSPSSPNHHHTTHEHMSTDMSDDIIGHISSKSADMSANDDGHDGTSLRLMKQPTRKSSSLLRNQRLFSIAAASANKQTTTQSLVSRETTRPSDVHRHYKSASFDATTTENKYENDAQSIAHDPCEDQGFDEDYCYDDDSYSSHQDSLLSDSVTTTTATTTTTTTTTTTSGSAGGNVNSEVAWSSSHTNAQHDSVNHLRVTVISDAAIGGLNHSRSFRSNSSLCGSDSLNMVNQNKHYQSSSSLSISNISHAASQHSSPSALLSSLGQNKSCQCYEGRSASRKSNRLNNHRNDNINGNLTSSSELQQTNPITSATLSDVIRQIVINHSKLSRLLQSIISQYDREMFLMSSTTSNELTVDGNSMDDSSQQNYGHNNKHHHIDISATLAALDECTCVCHHEMARPTPNLVNSHQMQQQQQQRESNSNLIQLESLSNSGGLIVNSEQQGTAANTTNSDNINLDPEQSNNSCCDTNNNSNNNNTKTIKRPKRSKGKNKKNDTTLDEEIIISRWCENCSDNHFEAWFDSIAAANRCKSNDATNRLNDKTSNKNHQQQGLNVVSQKNANLIKLIQQEVRSTLLKSIELIDLIRKQIKSPESIQQKHLLRCFANSIHLLTSVGCYVMPAQDVYNHFNQFINNNTSNCCPIGTPNQTKHNSCSQNGVNGVCGHVAPHGLCRLPSSDFDYNILTNHAVSCQTAGNGVGKLYQAAADLSRVGQHSSSMKSMPPSSILNNAGHRHHSSTTTTTNSNILNSTRYAHHVHCSSSPYTHTLNHNGHHQHHHHQPSECNLSTSLCNNMIHLSASSSSSSSSAFGSSYSPLSSPPMSLLSHAGGIASHVSNQPPVTPLHHHHHLAFISSSACSSPSSSPSSVASIISSSNAGGYNHHQTNKPSYHRLQNNNYPSAMSSSYCYAHPPCHISSFRSSATFSGNSTYYEPTSALSTHSATIGSTFGFSPLIDSAYLGNGMSLSGNDNQNSGLKFWQSPKFNFIRKIWHVRRQRLMRQQSKDRKLYNNKIQNKLKLVIGDYVHFHKSQTLLNTENGINSLCTSMKNALEFGLYLSQKLY